MAECDVYLNKWNLYYCVILNLLEGYGGKKRMKHVGNKSQMFIKYNFKITLKTDQYDGI